MTKAISINVTHNDDDVAVTMTGDALTADELGPVMAQLLHSTLGDDPSMADILKIQQTMMGALS